MTDKEHINAYLEEIEKYSLMFQKELPHYISDDSNHEELVKMLMKDLINTKSNATKVIDIAKSIYDYYRTYKTKSKMYKKDKNYFYEKYNSLMADLESLESKIDSLEQKNEILTQEIDDLERALKDKEKENQHYFKELNSLKKEAEKKTAEKERNDFQKMKSLSYQKEEHNRKISEFQIEITKKSETIESLLTNLKILEQKLENESKNSENLRTQVNKLKIDLSEKITQLSDAKIISHSYKQKNLDLEKELRDEKEHNEYLLIQISKSNSNDKKENSQEDFENDESDDLELKMQKRRSELLSDLISSPDFEIDLKENGISNFDENDLFSNDNKGPENLLYIINSPTSFSYRKSYNLSIDTRESINLNLPKLKKTNSSMSLEEVKNVERKRSLKYLVKNSQDINFNDKVLAGNIKSSKDYFIKV